jgi:hypothetical protein
LTESDGRFAVDNRLHYCWSEKREAETLSDNLCVITGRNCQILD